MFQNAISVFQMISFPIEMCGCFFCAQSWHGVEQIVKRTVIWDAMVRVWSHCKDNVAKRDFGITNDYVSNERVLMFHLLLVRICRWTNNKVAGDSTLHDGHMRSLITMLQNAISVLQFFSTRLKCLDISFALSHGMLLSKLSNGRWFRTPWGSCGVTVLTMLQNAISVLQMISSAIKVFGYFFALNPGMLLSKLSSGRWFGTSWRPCRVTVMTMLQNAILVLQMIMSPMRECWCFLCY